MKMQRGHFLDYKEKFKKWLFRLGYASSSIASYMRQLSRFFDWLVRHEISCFEALEQSDLEKYCESLHRRKNQLFGGALSSRYIQSHINVLRLLDQYLQRTGQGKLLRGKLPVEPGLKTHRSILSSLAIQSLYAATDDSVLGYRDRAILGIYYGCGLRSSEGERLKLKHLHYEKGLLQVLAGKNCQGRYVPLSAGVAQDLQAYQRYSRPYLARGHPSAFILGQLGHPLKGSSMRERIKHLGGLAGIPTQISLHSLRHSIATHLLQGGMPLEQISRFLGHTSLDSTQLYTRLAEELHE